MTPSRKYLVADLLCGAGGSSTGCERALRELGLQMELVCVNHWPTAIETHSLNHPRARHYVQDIATVRPHLIVPEGYLDLLMASPTCTHHSIARGGKPTSDQQRSDPWHVITWLTELRVKRIIIENVWEFRKWGPVDPATMKPIKDHEGEYFDAWIDTLRRLRFDPVWRKLNAADYGDATTRERFILMARNDGSKVFFPGATHAKAPEPGSGLKPWRAAREIIDWRIRGRSIYGRKKPLAFKTLSRIHAGAVKHRWPWPFVARLRAHMAAAYPEQALPAVPAEVFRSGAVEAVIVRTDMHGRKSPGARGGDVPLMTITSGGGIGMAEPLLLSQHNSGAARTTDNPLPTITTGGAGSKVRPGCARPMLAEPFVINARKHNQPRGVDSEPIPTLDTKGGVWLAEAFVLSQASGGAPRAAEQPLPTIVGGGQRGSGTALISPYYGSGSGETCTATDEPLPTVTSKGRFGMIVPVTHTQGGNAVRDVGQPIPTVTTARGGELAVVMPVTHHDGSDRARDAGEPLPTITGANRGELAFISAQFGEREGQPPRTHDLDAPASTGLTLGQGGLVEGVEDYDILFRMLEAAELASAMGFNDAAQAYEFAGTKTDQIKQIGNAVSVAKMRACVKAIMADEASPAVEVAA